MALLGDFGCGKSTILNAVRAELEGTMPLTIVAQFDVWAVPHPEDVPRLALNRIVSAVDDFADTIELRSLPLSYQRLAAAEPTGLVSKVLGHQRGNDSIEEVARLIPILDALDARLVLMVEDAERAGGGFETRHLERLLWTFRGFNRLSFIVAADQKHTRIDFGKLCDIIELVPPLHRAKVLSVLTTAYGHWLAAFSTVDVDPHPSRRDADKLGLRAASTGGMMDYISKTGKGTPLDALVSLLPTPRALKGVVRQVDRTWQNLHGEAELDDIIVISALKNSAQRVYDFLINDIDPARHKPDAMFPRTQTVKEDWKRLLAELPDRAAVQQLVDLLGIEQLTAGSALHVAEAPQGVHVSDPVDYFRRITGEESSPGAFRDQVVLHDIENWNAGVSSELVSRLVASSEQDETYARVWEHFSGRHTERQLADLTKQVSTVILARDGARASAGHPPMTNLWRTCNRRFTRDLYADWLRLLMLTAVPVSLEFVNDLHYYWAGDHGVVGGDARVGIRTAVVDAVRSTIRDGDGLVRITTSDHPYQVYRLVTETGRQADAATFAAWRDYLAPVLIDGGRKYPDAVIPEIANLVMDSQSGLLAARDEYPPAFINAYRIDPDRAEAFFGDRLGEALELLAGYPGDNAWAVRAKAEAAAWLVARKSPSNVSGR